MIELKFRPGLFPKNFRSFNRIYIRLKRITRSSKYSGLRGDLNDFLNPLEYVVNNYNNSTKKEIIDLNKEKAFARKKVANLRKKAFQLKYYKVDKLLAEIMPYLT